MRVFATLPTKFFLLKARTSHLGIKTVDNTVAEGEWEVCRQLLTHVTARGLSSLPYGHTASSLS